jgi:hypothetical protein
MLRTFGSPCPLGIAKSRFLTTPSRRPPMPSPTLPKAGAEETNDEVAGPSRKTWYRSQGFGLAAKTRGSAVSNLPWESSLGKLGPPPCVVSAVLAIGLCPNGRTAPPSLSSSLKLLIFHAGERRYSQAVPAQTGFARRLPGANRSGIPGWP